jgi:hypothetical protein
MLTSITPLGERGRASRWGVTTAAYLAGSVAGGVLLGAVLGTLGWLLPLEGRVAGVGAAAVLALAAALAVAVETRRLPAPPTLQRQVDEDWLHRYRGWVYGVGYGAQLGVGVVTIVTSTSLYVAMLLAVLTGSPAWGALVGLAFGLARALPVLGMRHVTTTAALTSAARRVEELAPAGRRWTAVTLTLVAVAATAQVIWQVTARGTGAA